MQTGRSATREGQAAHATAGSASASAGLVERDAELELIAALIARLAAGDGGGLLIRAPAGLGKTSLLAAGRIQAAAAGIETGTATGHERQTELPFGIVRGLLASAAARWLARQGPDGHGVSQTLAARRLWEAEAGAADMSWDLSMRIEHGLLAMLADTAREQPLLLVVDDAHWSDDPSLRFLTTLADHLDGMPIGVLIASRAPEGSASLSWLTALAGVVPSTEVAPLSRAGTAQLLRHRLGAASDALVSGAHRATGGNPLLLDALLQELVAAGSDPAGVDPVAITRRAPRSLARRVMASLATLPPSATRLATVVAVLGETHPFASAATMAGLDGRDAEAAQAVLVRAGILADAVDLRFVHPIVGTAVFDGLGARERLALHAHAAEHLIASGAPAAQVAVHLLHVEPAGVDEHVAILRQAAATAVAEGAPETATRLLRRAAIEPPTAETHADVLLELGSAGMLAGDPGCEAVLREVAGLGVPGRSAQASLLLGRMLTFEARIPDAVAALQAALDGLPDLGSDAALSIEAELLNTALLDTRTGGGFEARARVLLRRAGQGAGFGHHAALASLASRYAMAGGRPEKVRELADRALAGGALLAAAGPQSPIVYLPLFALAFVDAYDGAAQTADALVAEARRQGSAVGFAAAQVFRSHLAYRQGDLAAAEADARGALEVPGPTPLAARAIMHAYLSDVLLERGGLAEAEALTALEIGPHGSGALCHLLHSRGRVLLAVGRTEAALDCLRDCGRRLEAVGAISPGTIPWRSAIAEVLRLQDEPAAALAEAQAELKLARRCRAPRAIGVALLAVGRCSSGRPAVAALTAAVLRLAESGARLEQARALVSLGAAMRRDNRRAEAREPLRQGLDLAVRCGGTSLAATARIELNAAGARPRREVLSGSGALTPSEARVAQMAAGGMTRAAIALALFVTVKTVDTHLGRAYAKLGVNSRAQLREIVAPGEWERARGYSSRRPKPSARGPAG